MRPGGKVTGPSQEQFRALMGTQGTPPPHLANSLEETEVKQGAGGGPSVSGEQVPDTAQLWNRGSQEATQHNPLPSSSHELLSLPPIQGVVA